MRIKISLCTMCAMLTCLFSGNLFAKITVVNYACSDGKTLTVSYFLGNATKNATTVFDNIPHKMYYDPTSTHTVMIFREEPYSLHIENNKALSKAIIINVTKESQGNTLHDSTLYKRCIPE